MGNILFNDSRLEQRIQAVESVLDILRGKITEINNEIYDVKQYINKEYDYNQTKVKELEKRMSAFDSRLENVANALTGSFASLINESTNNEIPPIINVNSNVFGINN